MRPGQICGARAAKPDGWTKPAYPMCNRPVGHTDTTPHREYSRFAVVLHEWWTPLEVDLRKAPR